MPDYQSQDFLFQRIRELLPVHASLVDNIASILHVSNDSAYRRIRGETPLVLDEARELCNHYKLSLDHILNVQSGAVLFKNIRIDTTKYSYETYLQDLIRQLQYIDSFAHKEIIYRSKDMPLFHNFYFDPLIAFRYFFWMKSIIRDPDFTDRYFELDCISPEIAELSRQLANEYNKIPSIEIWNTESVNAAISQIEFYKDSGYFSKKKDIKMVYQALEKTIDHLKNEVEHGCKFMPEENYESRKSNFSFFYNRVILADTTIFAITNATKTVFLNYDGLNYVMTRDKDFCDAYYADIQSQMKRSTLISQTSEKQRNIFFNIMLNKIKDRIKQL
jgi:hypothetical protein